MKYRFTMVIFFVLIAVTIFAFPQMALNPITFTQMEQNPSKTKEKYKDIWDETKIKTRPRTDTKYKAGEIVATITIPKMEYYEMPVYYGSDDINNNWQITTPGYLGNWDMFGDKGRAGIGAHNYQLFKNLPRLKKGDKFIVETPLDIYVYEVTKTAIYDHTKDDWNKVAYAAGAPSSVTLMTCYPVDAGIEATEDMYLVYSKMVKGTVFES